MVRGDASAHLTAEIHFCGALDVPGRFTGERHDHEEGVVVDMADPEDHEFGLVEYYG
ncbi:hypothetical protein [Micromonospora sp. MA102]|uniref:hypothetical protein n=1 Tax=Micromonospora sp. MA102 TaxID=2952755 RepID=UPI0021C8F8C5|nr:hypothetical protein [Micromonospora sp. MA102]